MVGITRFPLIALDKFKKEEDSKEWMHRLAVHGVDLRSTGKLVEFLTQFKKDYKRIDIIINNAAQTIHRPPHYYKHLLDQEDYLQSIQDGSNSADHQIILSPAIQMQLESFPSSQATQIPIIPADREDNAHYFPPNKTDVDGEPLDARPKTSWSTKLGEVNYGEVLETHLINVIAPFTILNELMPLIHQRYPVYSMPECPDDLEELEERKKAAWEKYKAYLGIPDPGPPLSRANSMEELFDWPEVPKGCTKNRYSGFWELTSGRRRKIIVNVTSPEGQFIPVTDNMLHIPQKKGFHPHTDMAKAALNMLTCTSANDLARYDCYIFSVDSGWFTDMRPLSSSPVKVPLTTSEAAARVLQPVFDYISPFTKVKSYGCLLRNFAPVPW